MTSPYHLQVKLIALHRRLQAHSDTITSHTRGWNLVASLFDSNVRRHSLHTVAIERQNREETLLQIQEVQEQQVASLFLECWQEELAQQPSSIFLPTT